MKIRFVVSGRGRDGKVAARISIADGKIVAMQQVLVEDSTPYAESAVRAVRGGDSAALARLLTRRPGLATARLPGYEGRTLLHNATDWPGHYPNIGAIIEALVNTGTDVDAPSVGEHPETPLHWAASSDDVTALDALLQAGANINSSGGMRHTTQ